MSFCYAAIDFRVPSLFLQGLSCPRPQRPAHWGEYISVFHPQSARQQGKALGSARCAGPADADGGAWVWAVLAHAPYTLNACSADARVREFALETMADDLSRMEALPGNFYNLHPGSHVGQGAEAGISLIANTLNQILWPEQATTILLETMAGKGSEIGRRFEELREILDRVELVGKMGVCMDICHVFDAGYDIVNDLDGVLTAFDRVIGLGRLRAVHLADSQNERGSAKDRHATIGEGRIGLEAFTRIVRHPVLAKLPMCLETPHEDEGHAREIKLLRELAEEKR